MNFLPTIGTILVAWASTISTAIVNGFDRLVSPRVVRLTEQADGSFVLQPSGGPERISEPIAFVDGALSASHVAPLLRGSRIEISLTAQRFLFRTLELPVQASGFLEGIVRAQIDRLTPWSAAVAVFGCSAPKPIDATRISTVIAVTTRPTIMGYVLAALVYHPASVAIATDAGGAAVGSGSGRIKVYEQKAHGFFDVPRLTRALLILFGVTAASAAISLGAAPYFAGRIEDQRVEVARQIRQIRTTLQVGADSRDRGPRQLLERRKYETPASTLVLELLSQVLPDHTYVTELHILGNKLQVVGITRDAPSLIRLIEQSPSFTRATFFAPTTRAPSDPGERFHIEAAINPPGVASQ